MRRLMQEECLIGSNILRELSVNQNFVRARRRCHMEIINNNRLGRKEATYFYRQLLQGIKKTRR